MVSVVVQWVSAMVRLAQKEGLRFRQEILYPCRTNRKERGVPDWFRSHFRTLYVPHLACLA